MGVLYGKYAPQDPPGKFETGTGNFEGICGVLGALEYIEWFGEALSMISNAAPRTYG
jgi:selenocysteine lyase/cysteine desulfurase